MRSRIGFVANRIGVNLALNGTPIVVVWAQPLPGAPVDAGTGAQASVNCSGVMNVFGHVAPLTNQVRQFTEIQGGDLLLDVAPTPLVTVFPGQPVSGVVALDDLDTPRFQWGDQWYAAQRVGEGLISVWDARQNGVSLHRTLALRSL